MVSVTFLQADGVALVVDARPGLPLMVAARNAGVRGIIAECGGAAMCATCHCLVVSAPVGALPAMRQDEADTIEFMAHDPQPTSRLTCQITVSAALAGAVFAVATGR